MTVITLTPHQAASRAKVSRGTIMNALKDGGLTGFRDNRNRWQIKPEDLAKWLSVRTGNASGKADNFVSLKPSAVDENALRVAVLEAELKGERQRNSDLERDRDAWKAQAQELARRDVSKDPPAPSPRRRSWWPF